MFKKLGLAIIGASILVGGFFVQPRVALAVTPSANVDVKTNKEEGEKTSVLLNKLSQGLYAMTWPMLILAGTFTDNDVIYGTFIGLDKSLWGIWNMMRTFANFFIGFLFIVAVLAYFWDIKKDQLSPMKILPQMVLASVLVNASWFIIGTLLDLSTITTYAVGLLPMKTDETLKEIQIPKITITLSPSNSESKFKVELCGTYEPCVFNHEGLEISAKPCYYLGQKGKNGDTIEYKVLEKDHEPTDVGKAMKPSCYISKKDMLDNMKNLTGPFIAIFQSLMDSSQVAKNEASMSPATNASITIMKAMFLIALIIPLITLCIILVVRAILLWMIIVFSPIIFLFTAITGFKGVLGEKKSLSAVVSLIFLPVFVVFALSMSLVFMNALHKSHVDSGIEGPKLLSQFGCVAEDENHMTCTIKDGTDIEIELAQNDKAAGGLLKDLGKWVGRIIANLFGIGFMWVIVFAALKSSKITEGIASSIESFSTSMAKAAPLIPIAGAGMQSISSLKKGARQIAGIPGQRQAQQYHSKLEKGIEEIQQDIGGADKKSSLAAKEKGDELKVVEKVETDGLTKDQKAADMSSLSQEDKQKMSEGMKDSAISYEAIDAVSKEQIASGKAAPIGNADVQEALKQQQNRINLINYLKQSFINENISLFQATSYESGVGETFDTMYDACGFTDKKTAKLLDIAKKGIYSKEVKTDIIRLMKNFEELGFTDEQDIFKLLVKDLISDTIAAKDKEYLTDIYNDNVRKADDDD